MKGVLLLNAPLTTRVIDTESFRYYRRDIHYKLWKPFLINLLSRWILKTTLADKIFVIYWKHADDETLWKDIIEAVKRKAGKKEDEIEKETIMAKIAKFKELSGTNLKKNFDDMLKKCPFEYKNIFETNTGYPHYDVEQFLTDNSVTEGWKKLIVENGKVKNILQGIIEEIHCVQGLWDPPADKILRAFAYSEPKDVKVIICGTSPVTRREKPNGLSFSCNKIDNEFETDGAISKVHKALRDAGILAQDISYYCGHEEWARNGVLLLNAALTIPEEDDSPGNMKEHCRKWRPFLVELLNAFIEKRPQDCLQQNQHSLPMMHLGYKEITKKLRKYKEQDEQQWDLSQLKQQWQLWQLWQLWQQQPQQYDKLPVALLRKKEIERNLNSWEEQQQSQHQSQQPHHTTIWNDDDIRINLQYWNKQRQLLKQGEEPMMILSYQEIRDSLEYWQEKQNQAQQQAQDSKDISENLEYFQEQLQLWQQQGHTIPMMIWGAKNEEKSCENFALAIWNEISSEARVHFHTLLADHPTFPKETNFSKVVPQHFKMRCEECDASSPSFPSKAFATNTGYPHYDVEQFLEDNKVKDGWKKMIKGNVEIKTLLQGIINSRDHVQGKWIPSTNKILRAFAYCEPEDIKVIIIGTSPSRDYGVANGLSFSANRMESACFGENGEDICKVHDALREAGILSKGKGYYCGHQEWARKGVLLLNAALTIDIYDRSTEVKEEHCKLWRPFLVKLLETWIEETEFKRTVFVMRWGHGDAAQVRNFAQELWEEIKVKKPSTFHTMEAHDAPTTSDFQIILQRDDYKDIFSIGVEEITSAMATLSIEDQSTSESEPASSDS